MPSNRIWSGIFLAGLTVQVTAVAGFLANGHNARKREDYLVHFTQKNVDRFDDFDLIALRELGYNIVFKEDGE